MNLLKDEECMGLKIWIFPSTSNRFSMFPQDSWDRQTNRTYEICLLEFIFQQANAIFVVS